MLHWSVALDRDQWLEDAGAAAVRALSRLRQLFGIEQEAALLASRGRDCDTLAGRSRRPDRVPQVLLDVAAPQPQLASQRRGCSRRRQNVAQLTAQCQTCLSQFILPSRV